MGYGFIYYLFWYVIFGLIFIRVLFTNKVGLLIRAVQSEPGPDKPDEFDCAQTGNWQIRLMWQSIAVFLLQNLMVAGFLLKIWRAWSDWQIPSTFTDLHCSSLCSATNLWIDWDFGDISTKFGEIQQVFNGHNSSNMTTQSRPDPSALAHLIAGISKP